MCRTLAALNETARMDCGLVESGSPAAELRANFFAETALAREEPAIRFALVLHDVLLRLMKAVCYGETTHYPR